MQFSSAGVFRGIPGSRVDVSTPMFANLRVSSGVTAATGLFSGVLRAGTLQGPLAAAYIDFSTITARFVTAEAIIAALGSSTGTLAGRLDSVAISTNALSLSTVAARADLATVAISTNALSLSTAAARADLATVAISTNALSLSTAAARTDLGKLAVSTNALSASTAALANVKASSGVNADITSLTQALSALTASSGTFTQSGASSFSLKTSSGIDMGGGQIKIAAGGFILWPDGSKSTAAASGGSSPFTQLSTTVYLVTTSYLAGGGSGANQFVCMSGSTASWTADGVSTYTVRSALYGKSDSTLAVYTWYLVDGNFISGYSSSIANAENDGGQPAANTNMGVVTDVQISPAAGSHSVCLVANSHGAGGGANLSVNAANGDGGTQPTYRSYLRVRWP